MVTHGKGRNFVVFNNLAFLPRLACLMRFVLLVELPPMFLGFFMIHQVSDYCALV